MNDTTPATPVLRDQLDRELLSLLQANARTSAADLARQLGTARTTVLLRDATGRNELRATGQVVKFPGFLAVYEEGRDQKQDGDEDESGLLPAMNKGDTPAKRGVDATQHFTQPPPRYSEASLVKRLEELGIGRPSTYAATLQVLSSGAGSVASDYSVTAPTIAPITAGVGITPAPLTVLGQLAANKVYDGSNLATLSGGSLGGLVLGDQLTLTQAGTFVSLNVGTAIPVLASNTISGAAAGNYALTQPSGLVANITQLGSVTFVGSTGTGGTNWSNPANWTNNVLPVAGNVGTVNVPSGATVTYDALAGATQLTAINNDGTVNVTGGLLSLFSLQPITSTGNTGSVNVTGGGLSIANVMKAADFSLSGNATVTGAGTFTVTNSFSQSAGSAINMGGAVSITQATGPLAVGNVSGSSVALQSGSGGVVQQAATGLTGFLTVKTMGGANLANVGNTLSGFAVADVSTNVPSSGNIRLVNNGALDVQGISLANGSVSIETHSPITVSSPITASGNIVLAAPTASPSSNITINSTVTSTAGSISIAAYNNFIQNSNLSAALAIDVSAGGSLTFGPGAYSIGNPVMYSVNGAPYMPPWIASTLSGGATDFVVAFLDQFQAVLDAQQMASIDDPLGLKQRGQEGIVVEGEICKP